jgi:hypothetical protein
MKGNLTWLRQVLKSLKQRGTAENKQQCNAWTSHVWQHIHPCIQQKATGTLHCHPFQKPSHPHLCGHNRRRRPIQMTQDEEDWRHPDVFNSNMKGLPKEWIVFFSAPSQTRRISCSGRRGHNGLCCGRRGHNMLHHCRGKGRTRHGQMLVS